MSRFTTPPALSAAAARFAAWWAERSPRERVMLGVLGAILLALLLWFGAVRPVLSARAQAFEDIRTYETLSARIRAAGKLTPGQPGGTAPVSGAPVQAVTAIASAHGVVATVEPLGSGARATVADAGYDAVMAWIAEVGATQPLRVTKVSVQRRPAAGRVSASVEFAP
ncbi:type II secretion system protein M [Sphingomonas canadensis]|uniref:Type II secretion system protein M n=1 Tax=Sphingomonas canadensis TaxID=1219257 RepID=A0ABW3H2U0_9SPHN|nr:type II secretion system protein M [Sphingomonas canadensis]MCW3835747.1 type II secretion system protein M [Sphingomonas canadensis]